MSNKGGERERGLWQRGEIKEGEGF